MGIKTAKGRISDGCLRKVKPGEPFFVLRGQDRLAPALVRAWASLARETGCSEEKCFEAEQLAQRMERFSDRKFPD